MFCPHCGSRLEEDGNFCPFCGGSLQEDDNFYDKPEDDFYSRPQEMTDMPERHPNPPQTQWLIGRSKSCDIVIHSNRVSRQHCLITLTPDGIFVIEDLSSTNGTFLNGMPLCTPAQLYPGDHLAFADAQFTFQIDQGFPILV